MNENIKKLAADARGQMNVLTTVDEDQWEQSQEFVEKFAELIILKCAEISEDNFHHGFAGAREIKNYFGVE